MRKSQTLYLVEDVVDERVHDPHGLGADAGVGVDLLEHLVDVDLVGLSLCDLLLLAVDRALRMGAGVNFKPGTCVWSTKWSNLGGRGLLGGSLLCCLGCHLNDCAEPMHGEISNTRCGERCEGTDG